MPLRICFTLAVLLFLGSIMPAKGSHIVGGELNYTCVGQNQYSISLDIFQDCLNGIPTAIAEDTNVFIGIFNLDNGTVLRDSLRVVSRDVIPTNFSNDCVNNPPATCLWRVRSAKTYNLAPNNNGYRVMYIRCCRNASISNVTNPSQTGSTFFCDIPPANIAACNNSSRFRNVPPQIICVNNPLIYDHSASDADNDSLTYSFCESYEGGENTQPKPFPSSIQVTPVRYNPGFSATRPIPGNPVIQINPTTGQITGTPNILGRYIVTVCCHEWRNGIIINTVKREFQFVVTNCSKAVVADIPQFSDEFNTYIVECTDNTVDFVNKSTGGFAYEWDFGVPGATSTAFEPSFTYPDTGIYVVKLVVNRGSTCPDSISRFVKIYPSYQADFAISGLQCPNAPINFTDLSDGDYKPVVSWNWNFGDNNTSTEQNPSHTYAQGGNYQIQLISKSIKGCTDTVAKQLEIDNFRPFAGDDTVIVKGERVEFHASGGVTYSWTPATNLSFSERYNPVGYYPDTGMYRYNVYIKSALGCEGNDSINVWVVNQASVFVPNAFTPNGDGKNDLLKILSVGYSQIRFFRVFNRFGEMVFETNEFGRGWDGYYKSKLADVGTYFWVAGITDRFGTQEQIKGDAILIR